MTDRPKDFHGNPIVMGVWYWAADRTGNVAGTGKFACEIGKSDYTFFINGIGYDPEGWTFEKAITLDEAQALTKQRDAYMAQCNVDRGWLIQCRDDHTFMAGSPLWLCVTDEYFSWTPDSLQAIRFCRRSDAEQVAGMMGDEADRITEHQWG